MPVPVVAEVVVSTVVAVAFSASAFSVSYFTRASKKSSGVSAFAIRSAADFAASFALSYSASVL